MSTNSKDLETGTKKQKVGGFGMRTIVFALMMVASIGPLATYAYSSYNTSRDRILANAELRLSNESASNAGKVVGWIGAQQAIAKSMAADPTLKNPGNLADIESYLTAAIKQLPGYYGATTIGADGQQVARGGGGNKVNVADRPYFTEVMKGAPTAVGTGVSRVTAKGAFFVSAPVNVPEQEGPISVLALYANLSAVSDSVTGGRIGATGFSYLADSAGLILAHPDAKKIAAKVEEQLNPLLLPSGHGMVKTLNLDGKSLKVVSNKAGGNLVLITQMESQEIEAPLHNLQTTAAILIVLGTAIAAAMAYVLSAGISKKIRRLADATMRVTHARRLEEITRIEREIESIGGARELREMAAAIKKLTTVVKMIVQRNAKKTA